MMDEQVILCCEKMMFLRRSVLRQALFQYGIHLGQPEMLYYVKQNPGCSQRQMAEDAGVTAASIAASFKRMENAGLIRRRADTADMRCNRVYITQKGEEELERCQQVMQALNRDMLKGLDEHDMATLQRCMDQINSNLMEHCKKVKVDKAYGEA